MAVSVSSLNVTLSDVIVRWYTIGSICPDGDPACRGARLGAVDEAVADRAAMARLLDNRVFSSKKLQLLIFFNHLVIHSRADVAIIRMSLSGQIFWFIAVLIKTSATRHEAKYRM